MEKAHITEAESEILAALWRRGPLPFVSLIEEVQERQTWASATIKTLLSRLMHKDLVTSERSEGRQLYHPQLTREAYVAGEVQALVDRLFGGDRGALKALLDTP
ncbi:MAG: BlaI/MecI/CopY family transcriptional regulator [Caulobacteraceae bacterium]